MLVFDKPDRDARVERVILDGRIVGVIIRGSASAYFRSREGWGRLFRDASIARMLLERTLARRPKQA
jgi:hypothetical protein